MIKKNKKIGYFTVPFKNLGYVIWLLEHHSEKNEGARMAWK